MPVCFVSDVGTNQLLVTRAGITKPLYPVDQNVTDHPCVPAETPDNCEDDPDLAA